MATVVASIVRRLIGPRSRDVLCLMEIPPRPALRSMAGRQNASDFDYTRASPISSRTARPSNP